MASLFLLIQLRPLTVIEVEALVVRRAIELGLELGFGGCLVRIFKQ